MARPRTGTVLLRLSGSADWPIRREIQAGAGINASVRLRRLYQQLNLVVQRGANSVNVEEQMSETDASDFQLWLLAPAVFAAEHTDVGLRGWNPFIRLRWAQQLTYRHYLAERFVLTGRIDHSGRSEPTWQTERLRTDLRLRRSPGRPWFTIELEPYAVWQRETAWQTTPGAILRVQIEFGDYELYAD